MTDNDQPEQAELIAEVNLYLRQLAELRDLANALEKLSFTDIDQLHPAALSIQ